MISVRTFIPLFAVTLAASSLVAQNTTNLPEVIRGPFFSGTIRGPKTNDAIAMKGVVVTVGPDKNAYVCYDTDLMRVSLAWTGGFLEFGNTLHQIAWPPPPQVKGTPVFANKVGPGWVTGESTTDPRPGKQGPLPKDLAHYKGLYQHGDQVVLKSTVGGVEVLESPSYEDRTGVQSFVRTINVSGSRKPITVSVCRFDGGTTNSPAATSGGDDGQFIVVGGNQRFAVGILGGGRKLKLVKGADELRLEIPARLQTARFKIVVCRVDNEEAITNFRKQLSTADDPVDLNKLCKGGPAKWTQTVETQGVRGKDDEAYTVDTLTEPASNPYHSKTFFGGFDFFSDGRAAICTFHGDVWVVSGIDDSLKKLTWKRFATGLFQPLGLKIVKNEVYVLGRDQISILRDLNGDGEADFYENFNNDTIVTANYHEFSMDLHTDRAGNFYFAKGSPWEPEVTSPHQGCLFKVSKDGSKMEIVATGLRAPNGMTVGPRDEITVSDNQGHWMPSSKLNWVMKGGFYGMVPAAQRSLDLQRKGSNFTANPSSALERAKAGFKAWGDTNSPIPMRGYDEPMVWLPMGADNSSGGQLWVTSDKWGPLSGKLLFMSYGKCTLFEVLPENVNGIMQGGMVQLPLKFQSGIMRGRVNPRDGQVYLCGLRGWQSSATKDGGFYRVRYNRKPLQMPISFRSTPTGVELGFSEPLDAKTAGDAANYAVERWNYSWSGAYGSPEFSVSEPTAKKHDKPEVKEARLSPNRKTVALTIEDMKPADQLRIKFSLDGAEGKAVSQEIYATIHNIGPATLPRKR